MSDGKQTTSAGAESVVSAELWISGLLRYGVATSVSIVFLGLLLTFFRHPEYFSSNDALERLTNPTRTTHSLGELVSQASSSPGQTVVTFGLLLLISLPVARVALSLWLFRLSSDRIYVKITAAVLVLLTISFFVGAVH